MAPGATLIQRWKKTEAHFLTSKLWTKLQWKTVPAVCARPQQGMPFSGNWSKATISDSWKHLSRRWLFEESSLLRLPSQLMHGATSRLKRVAIWNPQVWQTPDVVVWCCMVNRHRCLFGASIDYTVEHFEPTDRATTREHRPKNAMPACQERVDFSWIL